jgi:hypothetical protein
MQHKEYNIGAPIFDETSLIIENLNFELVTPLFTDTKVDRDYHYRNKSKNYIVV